VNPDLPPKTPPDGAKAEKDSGDKKAPSPEAQAPRGTGIAQPGEV